MITCRGVGEITGSGLELRICFKMVVLIRLLQIKIQ